MSEVEPTAQKDYELFYKSTNMGRIRKQSSAVWVFAIAATSRSTVSCSVSHSPFYRILSCGSSNRGSVTSKSTFLRDSSFPIRSGSCITKNLKPLRTCGTISFVNTLCRTDDVLILNDLSFLKSPSSHQLLADFLPRQPSLHEENLSTVSGIHRVDRSSYEPSVTRKVTSTDKNNTIHNSRKAHKNVSMSKSMPPWLWRFADECVSSGTTQSFPIPIVPFPTTIELQMSMNSLKNNMTLRSHLSESEIDAVIRSMKIAVRRCSSPSAVTLSGLIDFVSILVEYMEVGHDTLIAGVFHYCTCIRAREKDEKLSEGQEGEHNSQLGFANFDAQYLHPLDGSALEEFGPIATKIAFDAGRLKRTEAIASTILNNDRHDRQRMKSMPGVIKIQDAKNLKRLLLTANTGAEWRSLAIRCAACLYRLRGLESFRKVCCKASPLRFCDRKTPPLILDEIRVAREALHIFAPLAHQLGIYRLKCELESIAFRVLYRRQFEALSALLCRRLDKDAKKRCRGIPIAQSALFFADFEPYNAENTDSLDVGMKSVMEDLSSRIKRILQEDETMMEHISEMKVSARIKEPYSLWRKMLEIHSKNIELFQVSKQYERPVLSVLQVSDAVALRVILRARKLKEEESDVTLSERERSLCYYAQQLCMKHLPSSNTKHGNRTKDYIANPKENGYQSLHYSAKTRWHGEEYPFEIQIRSADMHRIAEYGGASHWSYKETSYLSKFESRASLSVSDTYLRYIQQFNAEKLAGATSYQSTNSTQSISAEDVPDDGYLSVLFDLFSGDRCGDEQNVNKLEQSLRIERLRARAEQLAPYIEALSTARLDLAREKVFVFFNHPIHDDALNGDGIIHPSGSIISLPAGARVLDAVREEERLSGLNLGTLWNRKAASGMRRIDSDSVVLRNGMLTSLTQRLESGDVLTVYRPAIREDGCEVLCSF